MLSEGQKKTQHCILRNIVASNLATKPEKTKSLGVYLTKTLATA